MKGLITILLFCSLAASSQKVHVNNGSKAININGAGASIPINPFFRESIAFDNGYYDGFPMVSDVVNKQAWGVYKLSFNHAGAGPLMLIHTPYWGQHWTEDSIKVDGVVIHSTNHSFYRYASGRMVISYRVGGVMYWAYNDDNDINFTSTGTPLSAPGVDYTVIQSPIKMQESSYGSLIFAYYQGGSNGNPNSAELMESLDSGLTWSHKSTIYSYNNVAYAGSPRWRGNEMGLCETHPTGNESTSKWIAIVRTEVASDGGTSFMHFNSVDGANTWTQDTTIDAGSFTDDRGNTVTGTFSRGLFYPFLAANYPAAVKKFGDSIYIIAGERDIVYGYSLKYVVASPDSAQNGRFTVWSKPRFIHFYAARTLGSSTDCGYPVPIISGNNLFVSEYDVSTNAITIPGVTRRCIIRITKIK